MKETYSIHTIKNAMNILKLFTKENPEWKLSEISKQLHLNISTTKRLLVTLEDYGYILRDSQSKRYRLGYMFLHLSEIITTTMEIRKEARPVLEELVQKLDEAVHVHLGVLEGTDIAYLDKIESKHPIRLNSHIGKRNPSYCTACGKIMLAYQKEEKREKLVKKIEENGIVRYGQNTVASAHELITQLKEIQKQGFAICIDEFYQGISIGAPVYDYTNEVIAAISVTGRSNRIAKEDIPYFTQEVIRAAKKLSKMLGYFD